MTNPEHPQQGSNSRPEQSGEAANRDIVAGAAGSAALGGGAAEASSLGPEAAQAEATLHDMYAFFRGETPAVISKGVRKGQQRAAVTLAGQINEWTGPVEEQKGLDYSGTRDRFIKLFFAYRRGREGREATPPPYPTSDWTAEAEALQRQYWQSAESLWERYWHHTRQLHGAGFIRPHILATYTDSSELLSYARTCGDTPGMVASIANKHVTDPIGSHREFVATKQRLEEIFGHHPLASKRLITHVAEGYLTDPEAEIRRRLDRLEALPSAFSGVEGFDSRVVEYVANDSPHDPAESVRAYLSRRQTLKDLLTTEGNDQVLRDMAGNTKHSGDEELIRGLKTLFADPNTRDMILRELALMSHAQSHEGLLELALSYAECLRALTASANRYPGFPIDADILQYVAVTESRRSSAVQRYVLARGIQDKRNRGEDININGASSTTPTAASSTESVPTSPSTPNLSSIGEVAQFLESVSTEHVPAAISNINERISAIDSIISQLQSSITPENQEAIEARITLLQQAQISLSEAASVLTEGEGSVADKLRGYLRETRGE
ncbi:MAG TPA: hypothetical protein VMR45_05565 [Patescibacteria group bacterium]|nr:hypothetical protein [Patescibacteria group bacterium]